MSNETNAEAILDEALQLKTAPERRAYLKRACADNEGLHRKVQDMLGAHHRAGEFFERLEMLISPDDINETAKIVEIDLSEEVGSVIGRYKLLEKIGEGGMGVVYLAEQTKPVTRKVALKIIKLGMDTKQVVARFEAERQALAMMDHPNIARVLDGGVTDTGRPYFVMELVRGVTITEYCDQNKLSAKERIELFLSVCQALQSAHQKGIIHRDIKPSNVMVSILHDEPIAKVIDFGIAKATNQKLTEKTLFTNYSVMIGTPAYMSPEQAQMSILDVDTRTDIYSLGVLLYELLTGTTPFPERRLRSAGYVEMQRIIAEEDPEKPSTRLSKTRAASVVEGKEAKSNIRFLDSEIDTDLDWVTMKCLEKDRRRRYETANDLATDLKRHLGNEPVIARPPSTTYRLEKTWRRNKTLVTAVACVATALFIGFSVAIWQAIEAQQRSQDAKTAQGIAEANETLANAERDRAIAAERETDHLRETAETQARLELHRAYAADMNLVQRKLEFSDIGGALALLNRYRPQPGKEDLRGWEWRYLRGLCRSDASWSGPNLGDLSLSRSSFSVSHDDQWLSIQSGTGKELINVTNRRKESPPWLKNSDSYIVFSKNLPLASSTVEANGVYFEEIINTETGDRVRSAPHPVFPKQKAFSTSGDAIGIYTLDDGQYRVIQVSDGTVRHRFSGSKYYSSALSMSPDLKLLAQVSGNDEKNIQLIDLSSSEIRWEQPAFLSGHMNAMKFSPTGKVLVTSSSYWDGNIQVWNVDSGELRGTLEGHRSWVPRLIFLDEGRTLISAGSDQTVRIWDVENLRQTQVLTGSQEEVWSIVSLNQSDTILSGSKRGKIHAWERKEIMSREPYLVAQTHSFTPDWSIGGVNRPSWAFGPDSHSLLTVDPDKRLIRRSGKGFDQSEIVCEFGADLKDMIYSERGDRAVTIDKRGKITLWNLDVTPALPRLIKQQPGHTYLKSIVVEKDILIVLHWAEHTQKVQLININDGTVLHEQEVGQSLRRMNLLNGSVSRQGNWMYLPQQRKAHLLDLRTAPFAITPLQNPPRRIFLSTLSPDEQFVAVVGEPHVTKIYSTNPVGAEFTLGGHLNGAKTVTFSADMQRLVTGSGGKEAMKIWDFEYKLELLTLEGEGAFFSKTRFSPDGNLLGSMSLTGKVHIWRAPSWEEIEEMEKNQQLADAD